MIDPPLMVAFARFLMRAGLLVLVAAAALWIASKFGWFVETARWAPRAAGGGLLVFIMGGQIFFRRTNGVRIPPGDSHEQPPRHLR